jgi:hypothetical protein
VTPAEVKAWRERMGLSTRWLAERWDCPEQSVQRWERSRVLPAGLVADLWKLIRTFTVEASTLAASGAATIWVPRTDADSPDGRPAAWHRAVGLEAAAITSATLTFDHTDSPAAPHDPINAVAIDAGRRRWMLDPQSAAHEPQTRRAPETLPLIDTNAYWTQYARSLLDLDPELRQGLLDRMTPINRITLQMTIRDLSKAGPGETSATDDQP